MLSTGDAIKKKGSDTFTQYFLTDRDLSYEETVRFFEGLARNPHTTRFTINAVDNRVFVEGGTNRTRTLTNDPRIVTKALFNDVYEDIDEWVSDVMGIDVYRLSGSFDFDEKWTYVEMEDDGTISTLFRKNRGDILAILSEAETFAMG